MIILPEHLAAQLKANGLAAAQAEINPFPIVKFFDPSGAATWLITEIDPADDDRLFGLCDLGLGFAELGYVSLAELKSIKGPLGIGLERDLFFAGKYPLSVYAEAARAQGRITEHDDDLRQAAAALNKITPPDLPDPGK